MRLKFKRKRQNIVKKNFNNSKYNINSSFNQTSLLFNNTSKLIKNNKCNSFLDNYYINKFLFSKNKNKNIIKLNKLQFKSLNINKSFGINNDSNKLWLLNDLFLLRENFELGYNMSNIINFNQKYSQYYYTKSFRLKMNKYNNINFKNTNV